VCLNKITKPQYESAKVLTRTVEPLMMMMIELIKIYTLKFKHVSIRCTFNEIEGNMPGNLYFIQFIPTTEQLCQIRHL
jgi:hypothetical protein